LEFFSDSLLPPDAEGNGLQVLVPKRKLGIFSKIKEGENYNHSNTLSISRIYPPLAGYNLNLTQRLGKITVFGWALTDYSRG